MIPFEDEELIPISQVPAELSNRPHKSTVWRWIQRGCRGVRLATVLIGGRRYTSKEAIADFVAGTTAAAGRTTGSGSSAPRRARGSG